MTHFGIGIYQPNHPVNVGSLIRSAYCFDADYVFSIGYRYNQERSAVETDEKLPIWYFKSYRDLKIARPFNTQVVAIEQCDRATDIDEFEHPKQALYVLGREGDGLPSEVIDHADEVVAIDSETALNVATAGSIVMYDRQQQSQFASKSEGGP